MAEPQLGQDPDPSAATEEEQQLEQVIEQEAKSPPAEEKQTEDQQPPESRFERRQERQIERLTDRIAQGMANRQPVAPSQPPEPYQPLKYEEDEYDVRQLEQDRQKFAESRYQEGVQTAQSAAQGEFFIDRLERDNDYVASHYRALDEASDDFNPDLADTVNRMYLATIGFNAQTGQITNPGVRYRDYAKAFMSALDKVTTSQGAETAQNLARQSSRGGVRPTGTSRGSGPNLSDPNAINKMTQEEYEANKDAIQQKILTELGI